MSERIVIKEICEVYDGPHATPKKTVDGPVYLGIDAITDDGKINAKTNNEVGTVEFKNVSFKYPDADEYLLKDISFNSASVFTL